jgi:hypothetical protein
VKSQSLGIPEDPEPGEYELFQEESRMVRPSDSITLEGVWHNVAGGSLAHRLSGSLAYEVGLSKRWVPVGLAYANRHRMP